MHEAAFNGHAAVADLLLLAGPGPGPGLTGPGQGSTAGRAGSSVCQREAVTSNGYTALHWAVRMRHVAVVQVPCAFVCVCVCGASPTPLRPTRAVGWSCVPSCYPP